MTALHAMIKKYVLPNSRMEYNQMNLSFYLCFNMIEYELLQLCEIHKERFHREKMYNK